MPVNVMDAHYESFGKIVLPMLQERNIGVLGMKPMGDHIILTSAKVSAPECLRYALSLPTSVGITGCDSVRILEQAFAAPYTLDGVSKLLHRLGYSDLMPRPQHPESCPEAQEFFKEVVVEHIAAIAAREAPRSQWSIYWAVDAAIGIPCLIGAGWLLFSGRTRV